MLKNVLRVVLVDKINTVLVILVFIALAESIYCGLIMQEIVAVKLEIALNIEQVHQLKVKVILLQNQIEELKKTFLSVLLYSNKPSPSYFVEYMCVGCVMIAFFSTKLFFMYTPYMLNYTAKSWTCGIISYFYPLIRSEPESVYRDTVKNLFKVAYDTTLDTFVIDVKMVATNAIVSIDKFVELILKLF